MKYFKIFFFSFILIFANSCDKKENPLIPPSENSIVFATGNVKTSPAFFNFNLKDTNSTLWDIKFTTEAVPSQPGAPPAVFPSIKLNKLNSVKAKIIDGVTFESILIDTVTNLQQDPTDTTFVIGTKCFSYAGAPTHKLNPFENRTFIFQTLTNKIKMRMLTYYNEQGSSGYFKFEYVIK